MDLTPERLQSIAVGCVTSFLTKQASLSEAVSKEAQELELNSDQIKRVIEASNTIAYLRQLEKSADRTFEFPVADYNEVMAKMCIPDMDKSASEVKESEPLPMDNNTYIKKEAEFQLSEQETAAILAKELLKAKSNLEKIACEKVGMQLRLAKSSSLIHKDPLGLEKLAEVVSEDDYDPMLKLCGIEKRASEDLVFMDKELDTSREAYYLYKEAKCLVAKEKEIEAFIKKANDFFFEKRALFPALFGGAARLAGAAVGSVVRPLATSTGRVLGRSAATIGGGLKDGLLNTFSKNPAYGFAGKAFEKGITTGQGSSRVVDIKTAVKNFDSIKKTQGLAAA